MANETILVIDSEEVCRLLKQSVLTPAGYHVISAANPQAGLQFAQRDQPDLILLEPEINGGSGLDLLAALRKAGCLAPAILMTSLKSQDFRIGAFRLGIRDALDKPFSMERVCQAIDRALYEIRLMREREKLNHNLQATEAVRMTVITLSHYLNNNLMAISGVLTLLEEALQQGNSTEDMLEMLQNGKESLQGIRAVLKVLRETTDVEVSSYSASTRMVDIQDLLEKELGKVHKETRSLGKGIDRPER